LAPGLAMFLSRVRSARRILENTCDNVCLATYGVIVKVVVLVVTPSKAETVTVVWLLTFDVLIVNVPVLDPPGTVTLDGTEALPKLSDNAITTPPAGARPVRVTVPVVDVPAFTWLGLTVTPLRPGETESVAVTGVPPL